MEKFYFLIKLGQGIVARIIRQAANRIAEPIRHGIDVKTSAALASSAAASTAAATGS